MRNSPLNQSHKNNIFLIESPVDSKITNLFKKNSLIITFDYTSHKYLEKIKISHLQSEQFLSSSDLEKINRSAKNLSQWSNEKIISNLVTYDNLNFGSLFYVELHYFLLPLTKKVFELKKIISEYTDSVFYSSGTLSNIIGNMDIKQLIKITDSEFPFLYDKISVKTPFLNFKLSSNKFEKIKSIFESFSRLIPTKNHINTEKNILMIEFDLKRYEPLFLKSKNSKLNLIIHNRRRPLYHNMKSFQIFRNSNCIVSFNYFDEKNIDKNLISKKTLEMMNNLKLQEKLFEQFFQIDRFSIWKIIKFQFFELCKKRIEAGLRELVLGDQIFLNQKIDKIILLSENGFNEQIFLSLAEKYHVQTNILQHGLFLDDSNALEHNTFSGIVPYKSNKILVWGENQKKYFSKIIPKSKIEIIGNPVFDNYSNNQTLPEKYILLTATAPRKFEIKGYLVKYLEHYENTIFKICSTLEKFDKKIIIKTHPFMDEHPLPDQLNDFVNVQVKRNADTYELLKNCEFVIILGMSTIIIEAQILGKPVVFYENNYDLGTTELTRSKSCMLLNDENFESNIYKILYDYKVKFDLIQKGNDYVKQYLSNLGFAAKKILDYFEQNH